MITKNQLQDACRAMDNLADMGESFPDIIARRGVKAEDVTAVAMQRALRVIMLFRGERPGVRETPVKLSPVEMQLAAKLAAVWTDGLAVGLKVSEP